MMITCISESSGVVQETLRTLRFTMAAARIKNHPVRFLDPQEKLILELKEEIKRLRLENQKLRVGIVTNSESSTRYDNHENSNQYCDDYKNIPVANESKVMNEYTTNNNNNNNNGGNIMRLSNSRSTIAKENGDSALKINARDISSSRSGKGRNSANPSRRSNEMKGKNVNSNSKSEVNARKVQEPPPPVSSNANNSREVIVKVCISFNFSLVSSHSVFCYLIQFLKWFLKF